MVSQGLIQLEREGERGDVKGWEASLSLIFFIWKRGIKVQGRREEECELMISAMKKSE